MLVVKNLPAVQETWIQSLGQEDPPEEEMATHSSILAEESHRQRSLVGYSPWGHNESDSTNHSCMHMTTGKTIALTRQTFVSKVMSLLLNMLSRLVITFLPKNKCF